MEPNPYSNIFNSDDGDYAAALEAHADMFGTTEGFWGFDEDNEEA